MEKLVKFSHRIFAIEGLTAVSLTGYSDRALSVQVLYDERMIPESSFLFPGQYTRR